MPLYGELNVDTRYSASVEPNLYTDTVLIPEVTYTEDYDISKMKHQKMI